MDGPNHGPPGPSGPGRLAWGGWRRAAIGLVTASFLLLIIATITSLHEARSPVELLMTQEMGAGYMRQPAQDFLAPQAQQQYVAQQYYAQQPEYYAENQQLAGEEMKPVPCSQSLAGCDPPSPAEASMANPAEAPNYNSGEGMTYMPSSQSGVSDQDQSPDLSPEFLDEEAKSKKHMKKLAKLLKKSSKEQDALDKKVKELSIFVKDDVTSFRNDIMKLNAKDTDLISQPDHLVQGARGKIGIPGLNGLAGSDGSNGPPGRRGAPGPVGIAGPVGPPGVLGERGNKGARGFEGRMGENGGGGPVGPDGMEGSEQDAGSWKPGSYFCPGAGNEFTRLVDCSTSACRLEVQYNGEWGTVCDVGFTSTSASVACKGLGFSEGGTAQRRGGGNGKIWLSRVKCKGNEEDLGDCPRDCGGGGCSHALDVGLCCNGFNTGPFGTRKAVRTNYKTISSLREACYTPDTCVLGAEDDPYVILGGAPDFAKSSWVTKLSVGDYARFSQSGKGADNDKEMCVDRTCNMRPGQLASMDIPAGFQVTLYSQEQFKGSSITYVGPRKTEDLKWELWKGRTYSMKVTAAKTRLRSEWMMQVGSSQFDLVNCPAPSLAQLDWVGQAKVPFVNLHGPNAFRKYVPATPDRRFAATFYGSLKIKTPGKYTFCLMSSDGSKLWLNGKETINNDGQHGVRERCVTNDMMSGVARVKAMVFNQNGEIMIALLYEGPDTGGNKMFVRSESSSLGVPAKPEASNWALQVYKSSRSLQEIPDSFMVEKVGEATGINKVKLTTLTQIRALVPKTPSHDYVWIYTGAVNIETAGKYTFCSTSDDGSRLLLDGMMIVDNDGLHGARRYCAERDLQPGSHKVVVEGFQHYGGIYQTATYFGPDTGGSRMYIYSTGKDAGELPPKPKKSEFLMRMYSDPRGNLHYVKNLAFENYKGEAKVPYIHYTSLQEFRQDIPQTPGSSYEWAIYGNLKIKKPGSYKFCTTSADGSLFYIDDQLVENNDGVHGVQQKCGSIQLDPGDHKVFIPGFTRYGTAYMAAKYQGPDTGEVLRYLRSKSAAGFTEPPESSWYIRIFQSPSWGLRSMADANWKFLDYVGEGTVREIDFRNDRDFREAVKGTPGGNFNWVIYGQLSVKKGGTYQFCSTSDDGSFLFVDSKRIVNNDGLHGATRICGDIELSPGTHSVRVEGFKHHGNAYQRVSYSGPDTIGRAVGIPSYLNKKDIEKLPPIPPPSQWMMRVYSTTVPDFHVVPDVSQMTYVGEAKIGYVYFLNYPAIKALVPETPSSKYAWQIYGKIQIEQSGEYKFCSRSDDGSQVYIGSKRVVDNNGLHGQPGPKPCGKIQLNTGFHDAVVIGFQNEGGVYQDLTYKGPDTDGIWRRPKSLSLSGVPADKKGKQGQYGMWPPHYTWYMRIFKGSMWRLTSMAHASWKDLDFVGATKTTSCDFPNDNAFLKAVPQTPGSDFAWVIYGKININVGGQYQFCSTSDDGSFLFVDDKQIVNNDGVHGPRRICGNIDLPEGPHRVRVEGFKRGGGVYESADYSGPDTAGQVASIPSVLSDADISAMPALPPPSQWLVRVYSIAKNEPGKPLLNENKDCWGGCGAKQGPCSFCGSGNCCRKGWWDTSNGCSGASGVHGMGHVCVAAELPDAIPFQMVPDVSQMTFVGEKIVPYVRFRSWEQLRALVPGTPSSQYAWQIYGKVKMEQPGQYEFCSNSDDGSLLYVDGKKVVDNNGLHGAPGPRPCGNIQLQPGEHPVVIIGFQNEGGIYQDLTWKGPDTGNVVKRPKSVSIANAPADKSGQKGQFGMWPPHYTWFMRVFRGDSINNMNDAAWRDLDFVGKSTIPAISFGDLPDIRRYVPGTPQGNYVWVIYGRVEITQAGTYQFCSTSDDGSFLFVDDNMIVNNDGLHGAVRVCGNAVLTAGFHDVRVHGFQHWGGIYQTADYSGPDTRGQSVAIPSQMTQANIAALPAVPPPSEWRMKVFAANRGLNRVPQMQTAAAAAGNGLSMIGEVKIGSIAFGSWQDLRNYIPGLPGSRYSWQIFGTVNIVRAGNYEWCSSSDDGSILYIDNQMVVNNDGLHGAPGPNPCKTISMSPGEHKVLVNGFQNEGGIYQDVTYSGPDTGNRRKRPRSVSTTGMEAAAAAA